MYINITAGNSVLDTRWGEGGRGGGGKKEWR